MKIFIVVADENRGYEVKKEDVERALAEVAIDIPECSFEVKELGN